MLQESWTEHFDSHPDQGGVPVSLECFMSRHARSLAAPFTTHRAVQPMAFLFMGAPGSGKSRLRAFFESVRSAAGFVYINPDDFKAALPEYKGGSGAPTVHAESSWLAQQARLTAMGRTCSIMNDVVGASPGKYAEFIRRLKLNEYRVELACIHWESVDVLLDRVARRAAKIGRVVPESVVREAHLAIPSSFLALRTVVDAAFLFRGRSGGPELAWESVDGKITMHDGEFAGTLGL